MSSHPNPVVTIPDFTVTPVENEEMTQPTTPSHHTASPSSGLLSPHSLYYPRGQAEVPPSPTVAENDSISIPPSPTLTHKSSVHFQPTTLALRDNHVDENSGMSSLGMLSAGQSVSSGSHRRKPSNATIASSGDTEPDIHKNHNPLQYVQTHASSVAHPDLSRHSHDTRRTDFSETATAYSEKQKQKGGNEKLKIDQLVQDTDLDPRPFRFRPNHLAHMLDPKNLEALDLIGGVNGLVAGLGTNRKAGLSSQPSTHSEHGPGDGRPGAGPGVSHRHDPEKESNAVPAITLTEPGGEAKATLPDDFDYDAPFSASLNDRRRVYGENVLPERKSKSLWQLMLTAFKDKVLVISSHLSSTCLTPCRFYCLSPPSFLWPWDFFKTLAPLVQQMTLL